MISASYSQIIELFPTGGGGYLVASLLLGPYVGLVSGCALLVDYVLTISISIASGADALFSFLPIAWHGWKLWTSTAAIVLLIVLNLRGVRESVLTLVPIFIAFVVTHALMIVYALVANAGNLPDVVHETAKETHRTVSSLGLFATLVILLRAFSLGGGTFTGIEAVSNGLQILRAPKVETGKRTMRYMSISLAFTAAGLLISFLLIGVREEAGRTLNATLFYSMTENWVLGGLHFGRFLVMFTLLSESALLFVAAQAGFLDGPRVLANMAIDFWVPTRFAHLSDRLVTQDGVLVMGACGARHAVPHARRRRHARRPLLDQRILDLHTLPARHGDPLVAGACRGASLVPQAPRQRRRALLHGAHPRRHARAQVRRRRLGHRRS